MCYCVRCLLACFVSHLSTASACGGVCGTTGADIVVGGRGVSVQAAGYPIMSGLPLHPFPSNLPSSQHQREVSRGQAGPSLYHYPSITCHPPSADNRTFPPSLFTLRSHHWLRLFMISHPSSFFLLLWFSHLLTLHLFPHSLFFIGLLFVSFCAFDSKAVVAVRFSSFSHTGSENLGAFCWGCSWSLDCYGDTVHPLLPSQTGRRLSWFSFRGGTPTPSNFCRKRE